MTFEGWQLTSQIVAFVGAVAVALGGLGHFYFGKQLDAQRADAAVRVAQDTFLRSLHFHRLEGYWISVGDDKFHVGLVAHILNKDATRALVFDRVRFSGTITLRAESGGFYLKSAAVYRAEAVAEGQYYLRPGTETPIYLRLPAMVEMQVMPGGAPGMRLDGIWSFTFEGTTFNFPAPTVAVVDVVSEDVWRGRTIAPTNAMSPTAARAADKPLVAAYLPISEQLSIAKQRIGYVAYEHLKRRDLSVLSVLRSGGDNQIEDPSLIEWEKVTAALEGSGHIKITQREPHDIAFIVLRDRDQWGDP